MPKETALASDRWSHRHAAVLTVLWCHVAAVLFFAVIAERAASDVAGDLAVALVPAIIASAPNLARPMRAGFAVFGLAVCCELLVGYSGGSNDVDILLLLTVVVSALYRSWSPFLLTVGLVALHYTILTLATVHAAGGQSEAIVDALTYVGLRGLFLFGAALLGLASWRLDEVPRYDLTDESSAAIRLAVDAVTLERSGAADEVASPRTIDSITGLANRSGLMRALTEAHQRANGRGPLAVLLLDIDRFKMIKGSLGHPNGNALLAEVGRRLRRQVGPDQTVARVMGDVFILLLEDASDLEQATRQAEAIVACIAHPFELGGHEVTTTASAGIAFTTPDAPTVAPDELVRRAEVALHAAKARGRGRVAAYAPSSDAMTPERLQLEADLHHAIERRELLVYYQPLVRLSDGRTCGLEALVRWRHPRLGIVSPDRFIPIAEETGFIVPLDRWVLRQAAFQVAAWRRHLPAQESLRLRVNVSPVELRHPRFLDSVAESLHDSGLPPACLTLEVTESALVGNEEAQILSSLHEQGIQVAIDDFGTGYSSLSYLNRLPAAFLKIDRSFVASMQVDSGSASIVDAIVAIARSLEMGVTAEGIETARQLQLLREAGCDFGQGFLFGPPAPIHEAERRLLHGSTDRPATFRASLYAPQQA